MGGTRGGGETESVKMACGRHGESPSSRRMTIGGKRNCKCKD